MSADDTDIHDLIIIKRHHDGDHDSVHGGVWKIAFADFMTAMMCFFLVMWLINAANEDTRQAVASYFNPVRLAELNRKGIADPHFTEDTTASQGEATLDESAVGAAVPAEQGPRHTREELFKDPYKVLAEIAGEGSALPAGTGAGSGGGEGAGAGTGAIVFRDPFGANPNAEPVYAVPAPAAAGKGEADAAQDGQAGGGAEVSAHEQLAEAAAAAGEAQAGKVSAGASAGAAASAQAGAPLSTLQPGGAATVGVPMSVPPDTAQQPQPPAAMQNTAEQLAERRHEDNARLQEAVRKISAEAAPKGGPEVSVQETGEGVLISLTDDAAFGMFAIGSAEPRPETIRVMEQIAAALAERPGEITIRGHTDGRPFRTPGYDNWQLSTDRAQIAYHMLVRGGLDKQRVEAIEGYADRKLKVPSDPDAAENRRIEILLRETS